MIRNRRGRITLFLDEDWTSRDRQLVRFTRRSERGGGRGSIRRERVSRVHSLENRATNKKPPQVPVSTAWLLLLAYTFIDRPDTGPSLIFDSAEREIHSLPETRPAGPAPPPSKNQRLPTATANTESR